MELGFIQNLEISEDGVVAFDLVLTTPACPIKEKFRSDCTEIVMGLNGVTKVELNLTANTTQSSFQTDNELLLNVKHIVGVASGKGGVGKSSVTSNLAMSLAMSGAKVGILDADIYGPSQVMMFGIEKPPHVNEDKTVYPVRTPEGIKVISMAMFADNDEATIWRGPMASQMINNFISRVHWGELDYLLVDLPPGTGDIQLTLTQNCPLSGAIVVTTPQDVSLIDAKKGLKMFEKVNVPILGIIENMSYFICDGCDKKHFIFKNGGGNRIANAVGAPFLGELPLEPKVAYCADSGKPAVLAHPDSQVAGSFFEISGKVASQLSQMAIAAEGALGSFDYQWNELELWEAN